MATPTQFPLRLSHFQGGSHVTGKGREDLARILNDVVESITVGAGGGGSVVVADIEPDGEGAVSERVYLDPPTDSVLLSCTTSTPDLLVQIRASYPVVRVNGDEHTLAPDGGLYSGSVAVTIPDTGPVVVEVLTPAGVVGATHSVDVLLDTPPAILTLAFTGGYPGAQTELKQGDSFQITGTTDKPCTGVRILDYEACELSEPTFPSTTTFVVTATIADRGDAPVARPARVQARNVAGAYGATRDTNYGGGTVDGVNLVTCNDLHPTVTLGAVTYPGGQQALKDAEGASVAITALTDFDSVLFDSPNAQLSITAPTTPGPSKAVSRIAGEYNVSVNNFRCTATRAANDAVTVAQRVVNVAHVACTFVVNEPAARLRSGGNDGTAAQNHTITIIADQQLLNAPALDADAGGGTFLGSWSGAGTTWTRTLQVHDNDTKGTYSWQNPSATNLAGIVTSAITGDGDYVLGGFVARTITFPAFSQTQNINVEVVTYSKLQAGIFTATNQPAIRHTPQGDHGDAANEFTVDSLSTNPTAVWWNDVAAAGSNSSGTAQLTNIQETV